MAQSYRLLRNRMREYGYEPSTLSVEIKKPSGECRGASFFANCACGISDFRLHEIYQIMRLLDIPSEEMHLYFTERGMYVEPPPREETDAQRILQVIAKALEKEAI